MCWMLARNGKGELGIPKAVLPIHLTSVEVETLKRLSEMPV